MNDRTETLTAATAPSFHHDGSYVDWSAALAGTVVATAIAFVFTTFGAALGLSFITPYSGEGSATAALVAVGTWMLWTTISSFMVGGYITGRMRRRVDQASADEVSVRDGIHGLAVWGVAVLIGAVVLGTGAETVVQAGADMANTATSTVTEAEAAEAAEAARKAGIVSSFVVAASLFVAAAAAYWAAGVGGQHRDEGRLFARFGRWT